VATCPAGYARQAVHLRRPILSDHQVLELCQIVNGRAELFHTGTEVRRGGRRKLAEEILACVRIHPSTCCDAPAFRIPQEFNGQVVTPAVGAPDWEGELDTAADASDRFILSPAKIQDRP
jgi:hypothetical protein